MKIFASFVLALALAGCPKPIPGPTPPSPDADAAAMPTCATACARGAALGCAWAKPTANGVSCDIVCGNANRLDGPIRWDLRCRTIAVDCSASDTCSATR